MNSVYSLLRRFNTVDGLLYPNSSGLRTKQMLGMMICFTPKVYNPEQKKEASHACPLVPLSLFYLVHHLGVNLDIVVTHTAESHSNACLEHNLGRAGEDVECHNTLCLNLFFADE